MTLRQARIILVLCGLLAVVAGYVNGRIHLPWLGGLLLFIAPFVLLIYPIRRLRRTPSSAVHADGNRFVVSANPFEYTIFYVPAFFAGMALPTMYSNTIFIFVLFALPALGFLYLYGYTTVILTPSALIVRRVIFKRTVPWNDLAFENVMLLAKRRERYLSLGPGKTKIRCLTLLIKPELLLAMVEHYLRHPEYRPAIGTADELERLQRESVPG
jgi:hypothetical protein